MSVLPWEAADICWKELVVAEGLQSERTYGAELRGKSGERTPGRASRNDALEGTFYRLTNNIDAMHCGCTFLIRKVQDTSAQLADVRCSMPRWCVVCAHLRECVTYK